ncbi:MAG TPA: cellulose biosynthesis cyclic di-GMP-binding regulatory protein BcsB [Burkholderiaceae bacterium]|nr:cellulose biosynthesis cyclic di-GMP-binding regulatory protein BcsB [Burkholderiaceae bacterium]
MFKRQLLAAVMFGAAVATSSLAPDAWAQSKKSKQSTTEAVEVPVLGTTAVAPIPQRTYGFTFKQLGVTQSFQLRGIDAIYSVPFSIPADEVVTAVKVKLDFSYSPSLLTNLSHLKILLNGEVAQTLPLPKETAGSALIREISIDPRLVADFNQLSLQFIGHYTLDCEDPFHSSLWMNVSNLSSIHFTVAPLSVVNDLVLLPGPFFDRRDGRRLERPFVFGTNPSTATLEAAGIVASWFGDLASYRGALFPAHFNRLPNDNLVLFATSDDRPQGLVNLPAINGPSVSVVTHPADSRYKILLVMGRDATELRAAATSLALAKPGLAGQTVSSIKLENLKPRVPYDAPRWLPSDRPVKFGDLATLQDLNVRGLTPDLVRLNMTTPPDLFGWNSKGVPVDLKYRYTPRVRQDKSNLNILVNDKYVTSYPLLPYPGANAPDSAVSDLIAKIGPGDLMPGQAKFNIPLVHLRSKSQMQFHFSFDYPKEGACRDVVLDNMRAAIDPESVIDISSFPHYLKMPDVSAFANTGFPFTRMADLSETAVVLPDSYSSGDVGTYLTLMGRMGQSTGLPVYGVAVTRAVDVQKFANRDILLLGGPSTQSLFKDWAKSMPFSADGELRYFSMSDLRRKYLPWYESPKDDKPLTVNLSAVTLAREAVVFGFQSPMNSSRSVVALTSDRATGQADLLNAMMDEDVVPKIQGGIAVVRGKDVDSMEGVSTYYVGSLPPVLAVRWALSNNIWLAVLLIVLVAIILAGVFYTLLRRQAGARSAGK